MKGKKKPPLPPPEPTLEVPVYNPALDSATDPPRDKVTETYPLLDVNAPNPSAPAADPLPETTTETPSLDQNPARRKPKK